MARLLSCPHCRAEFTFDDWARTTSCPACARRLSFFEASSQTAPVAGPPASATATPATATPAAVAPAAAAPAAVAPPVSVAPAMPAASAPAPAAVPAARPAPASGAGAPARAVVPAASWAGAPAAVPAAVSASVPVSTAVPSAAAGPAPAARSSAVFSGDASRRHVYTIGGKALEWSAAWTVVVVIWALVAAGLVATRVEMGGLTVMTPAETAAIAAVRQIKLPSGASTEAVLRYAATHDLTIEGHVAKIPPGGTQMWYVFDRPWEHRIYVYSQLPGTSMVGKGAVLSWTFSNGVARPDAATRAALTKTAQTMAHPPSSRSVPAIPGVIPSLPADMQ
jgi:hypothetical protein